MNAEQLLSLLTQVLFILIFLSVLLSAVRRPRRAIIDTALLFGAIALIVVESWITEKLGITLRWPELAVIETLLMALPYLLIRLVGDFTDLPHRVQRAAEIGFAICAISFFVLVPPYNGVLTLLYVLYFAGFTCYVATMFVRAARNSSGVTQRRMQAVAAGTICLALTIVLSGLSGTATGQAAWWTALGALASLSAGIGYFIGFTPPVWLRRTWQEPGLHAFLRRASALPRLADRSQVLHELERGTASALGVATTVIGVWDEATGVLRYENSWGGTETAPNQFIGGRAFILQQPVLSLDAARDDPDHADVYRQRNVRAILAAPITAGDTRLGVIAAYAAHAPLFADDDLLLMRVLADQAAVILESHDLIDATARVRAREETARLKDDFLSAAAHDLKTPLTAVMAQAQLLERRARRNPTAPVDMEGVQRIVREADRLKRFVLDLLDLSRVEEGKLASHRERVDLVDLARAIADRHGTNRHPVRLDAEGSLLGEYDEGRIVQLLDNLVENAIKYSPDGGEVLLRFRREGEQAHLMVVDCGIGIPTADLPYLFDRFHRGHNVDDRRFAGMGLGLFICRGIVEQHGGSIWAVSPGQGQGSTFHVLLPIVAPLSAADIRAAGTGAMSRVGEVS